jgi:hypothetical protein
MPEAVARVSCWQDETIETTGRNSGILEPKSGSAQLYSKRSQRIQGE